MNNNILTIKKNITLRYIVTGCAWLLYGILALIPNTISKIISIVSLLIAVISSILVFIKKTENDDEMSRFHFSRACEISILITLIVVLLSDMICSITVSYTHLLHIISFQSENLRTTAKQAQVHFPPVSYTHLRFPGFHRRLPP